MQLIIEPNSKMSLRWEGANYVITNAAIVEGYPEIDISPFDAELAHRLKQHILEHKALKLELHDGFYELPPTTPV